MEKYRILIFIVFSIALFFTQREIRAEQSLSFLFGILLSEKKVDSNKLFKYRNGIVLILFGMFFLIVKQLPVIRSAPQMVMNAVQLFIKLPIGLGLMILIFYIKRKVNLDWLKWSGVISYELYLIHGYVLEKTSVTIVGAVKFFTLTILLSVILWIALDKSRRIQKKLLRME